MHSPISESMPEPPENEWFGGQPPAILGHKTKAPPGYVPLWWTLAAYVLGGFVGLITGLVIQ